MTQPVESYLTVNGIRTRQWECGSTGKDVLFLHGVTNSIESWKRNLSVVGEHHHVRAIDLIGSGRTDKPRQEYSFKTLATFVKQYLDTIGVRRAVLVGHSMGGGTALEVAMNWPELVERLVLVSPAGLSRKMNVFLRLPVIRGLGELLLRPSRFGASLGIKSCVYDKSLVTPEWITQEFEIARLPGTLDATLATLRTLNDLGGLRPELLRSMIDRLPTVKAPTLVAWGRDDEIQPVAASAVLKEKLPSVDLHIFEKCGHMAHYEYPERFNTLVTEFLAADGAARRL